MIAGIVDTANIRRLLLGCQWAHPGVFLVFDPYSARMRCLQTVSVVPPPPQYKGLNIGSHDAVQTVMLQTWNSAYSSSHFIWQLACIIRWKSPTKTLSTSENFQIKLESM